MQRTNLNPFPNLPIIQRFTNMVTDTEAGLSCSALIGCITSGMLWYRGKTTEAKIVLSGSLLPLLHGGKTKEEFRMIAQVGIASSIVSVGVEKICNFFKVDPVIKASLSGMAQAVPAHIMLKKKSTTSDLLTVGFYSAGLAYLGTKTNQYFPESVNRFFDNARNILPKIVIEAESERDWDLESHEKYHKRRKQQQLEQKNTAPLVGLATALSIGACGLNYLYQGNSLAANLLLGGSIPMMLYAMETDNVDNYKTSLLLTLRESYF